jgi:hypothetical protein
LQRPPVLDVYIGYDSQEIVAYHVLCQSIVETSSHPVRFTPINLASVKAIFQRAPAGKQTTEFSFSRFLTPYLSGYAGWSLFIDCDMLVRGDIAELFALADERYAVMVCQHDYTPKDDATKFLGRPQTPYAKKNWSSVMLLNTPRCRASGIGWWGSTTPIPPPASRISPAAVPTFPATRPATTLTNGAQPWPARWRRAAVRSRPNQFAAA